MSKRVNAYRHKCKRCGHSWTSVKKRPTSCAACKSAYWNQPRKLKPSPTEESQ